MNSKQLISTICTASLIAGILVTTKGSFGQSAPSHTLGSCVNTPRLYANNVLAPTCGNGQCAVVIKDGKLFRDGISWVPKGVVLTGFVAPKEILKGTFQSARDRYDCEFLDALVDNGVDAIRINVSVPGLHPSLEIKDESGNIVSVDKAAYKNDILLAIKDAQSRNLVVILTMMTNAVTGLPKNEVEQSPGPQTAQALKNISESFVRDDKSIVLSLFNEPTYRANLTDVTVAPATWQKWKNATQILIDAVRAKNAKNVLMVSGINLSRVWKDNAQMLSDPLSQLMYDIHPFPSDSGRVSEEGQPKIDYYTTGQIEKWLGGWCDDKVCLASASFTGGGPNPDTSNCYDGAFLPPGALSTPAGVSSPEIMKAFVNYFSQRQIGTLIFAGDWNHRFFRKLGDLRQLTSYEGFTRCIDSSALDAGPGELMRETWLSTLHLAADKSEVYGSEVVQLSWSSTLGQCSLDEFNLASSARVVKAIASSGSQSVLLKGSSLRFTLMCVGEFGSEKKQTVLINAHDAKPEIGNFSSQFIGPILAGSAEYLKWETINAASCDMASVDAVGAIVNAVNLAGKIIIAPSQTKTFTLRCQNKDKSAGVSKTLEVKVLFPPKIMFFTAQTRKPVSGGIQQFISWESQNSAYCRLMRGDTGTLTTVSTQGQEQIRPYASKPFILSCYNQSGTLSTTKALKITIQ